MVTNIADHTIYDPLKPPCAALLQQSLLAASCGGWSEFRFRISYKVVASRAGSLTHMQSYVGQLGYLGWRLRPLLIIITVGHAQGSAWPYNQPLVNAPFIDALCYPTGLHASIAI